MRRDDAAVSRAARRSRGSLSDSRFRSEDELVAALGALLDAHPVNRKLRSRIGDDAAVWQPSRSHRSVVTTDALLEGRHFRRETMPLADIGRRAMASNISDLAAMGARPVLATVALGIPQDLRREDVFELYRGMLEMTAPFGCAIAGGDTTRSDGLFLSITAIGEVRPSNLKGRSGGKPGDVLAVTGPLGASRAGLHLADNQNMIAPDLAQEAQRAHRAPQPRVREGMWLAASTNVHAMMDISDGLSTDVRRLAAASKCAAVIDDVPVAESARAMAQARGEDAQRYALAGGEDFELLAAIDGRAFDHLRARFYKRFARPLFAVGVLREGSGVFERTGASETELAPMGWDHLA